MMEQNERKGTDWWRELFLLLFISCSTSIGLDHAYSQAIPLKIELCLAVFIEQNDTHIHRERLGVGREKEGAGIETFVVVANAKL